MATPLHCSQNHSPLGAVESPTHWKWNHSMGQSLCSPWAITSQQQQQQQPLFALYIYTLILLNREKKMTLGSSTNTPQFRTVRRSFTRLLEWSPFSFCSSFLGTCLAMFSPGASLRCLTHISTSLERSKVCFAQSSSYFWKIMRASLTRLKHSLTVTSTSCFCRSSSTLRLSSYWNKTWIKWKMRTGHDMNLRPFGYHLNFNAK